MSETSTFTFDVDGTTYEMPAFNPDLFTPRVISFPEACELKARMSLDEYEEYRLQVWFGNTLGIVKAHLVGAEHLPALAGISRLIESSSSEGYRAFFDFFANWTRNTVEDESGESSGSQES